MSLEVVRQLACWLACSLGGCEAGLAAAAVSSINGTQSSSTSAWGSSTKRQRGKPGATLSLRLGHS